MYLEPSYDLKSYKKSHRPGRFANSIGLSFHPSHSCRLGTTARYTLRSTAKLPIGILIDPDKCTVTIYRPAAEPVILRDGDIISIPELLPGWEVPVAELWPIEFE